MSIIRFIRNWTLPIAMLTGIIGYFVYVNIHALDGTHTAVAHAIEIIQPTLIFLMLFVSFCKISPRQLRPHKWHLKLLAVQVISFSAIGLFLAFTPDFKWKILAESAMICLICPTATAAAGVAIVKSQLSIFSKAEFILLTSSGSPQAQKEEGVKMATKTKEKITIFKVKNLFLFKIILLSVNQILSLKYGYISSFFGG